MDTALIYKKKKKKNTEKSCSLSEVKQIQTDTFTCMTKGYESF